MELTMKRKLQKLTSILVLACMSIGVMNGFAQQVDAGTKNAELVTLAHYAFENNANDSSGNGNNGVIQEGVTFDTGYSGQAAVFNGSSGYIELPQNLIRNHKNFTISTRFKTSSYGAILGYQNQADLSSDKVSNQWIPILIIDKNGKMNANFWTGTSSETIVSSNVVNDNEWHQVELEANDHSVSLYLDGILVGTKHAGFAHLEMKYNQLGAANAKGYSGFTEDWVYYNGLLDDWVVKVPPKNYSIQGIVDQMMTALINGYEASTQQTKIISIINNGKQNLENLKVDVTGTDFEITQPEGTLNSGASETSFTLRAKDGLGIGTYTETVMISADNMEQVTFKVTQMVIPAAPTNVTAVAGDGQATVSFTVPSEDGGSPIVGYEVTASPGDVIVNGSASPVTIKGLINGTSYSFTVKAVHEAGKSEASVASNEVVPFSPSIHSNDNSGNNLSTPLPTSTGVNVLFNGKVEDAGTATTSKRNNQTVTSITLNQKRLEDKLALDDQGLVVTIPMILKSDIVIGELNGQMVKSMEQKQAVLEIQTENATYKLPAQQINIDDISNQVGSLVALQDIKIQIEIAVPTADTVKIVEDAAVKGNFTLIAPPVDFTVRGTYGNITIEISKFDAYVERTIAIPDSVDPGKITTAVVVDPDGMVRHVPTKVVLIDGKYFAVIHSLSNSTYTVVWHSLEFSDVVDHWAKASIDDMSSRLVIEGTGNHTFSPDQKLTRAEFAALIVRSLGLKLESGAVPFTDLSLSDLYSHAIKTAYEYRLINGFQDETFRPNDAITREQAMVIIAKAMSITEVKARVAVQSKEETLRPFKDAMEASGWAESSIAAIVEAGIVAGRSDAELAPKAYMTRAEGAAMLQRLLQKSELI